MADRFFIGPYNSGLVRDKKPFLIPDEAFERLRNAYVWRDRVRKRFGARVMNGSQPEAIQQLYTRFRVKLNGLYGNPATTDGAGNFTGTVPVSAPNTPIVPPAIGQLFSVVNGSNRSIFTVNTLGNPATLLSTSTAMATFDTTTGAIVITGAAPNSDVYYFPALPVMGLETLETATISDERIIGFDTRFAYNYDNGVSWERFTGVAFSGTDTNFFWVENYRGTLASDRLLFVTNFNQADGIYYFDGVTTWTQFQPVYNVSNGDRVLTCQIIVAFQGRLIFLNTVEEVGGTPEAFRQRARFSQNGNPIQSSAFYAPPTTFGKGDSIDAPTSEAIVTALILKDRLIVYFERSTWELVYTGNQVVPFVWQTINVELGAESTESVVPFDLVILAIGDVGVHSCNGANTTRIDEKIPDEIFQIHNKNSGPERVCGVRDYNSEMVYWAFPDEQGVSTEVYPSKVLVYNYRNGAWAVNDDSITAFGQYQFSNSLTWANTELTWEEADFAWRQGFNGALSRNVIAGNQEGFTFIIDRDIPVNSHAIQITDVSQSNGVAVITAINHNLADGDYIYINYCVGANDPGLSVNATLNQQIFQILADDADRFTIETIQNFAPGATYAGGGTFRRVSVIDIITKQYNFYLDKGYSFTVNKIDFLVDRESTTLLPDSNPGVTVNTLPNTSNFVIDSAILSTAPYSSIYAPMESQQDSLWHTIYPAGFGTFLQFQITLTDSLDFTQTQIRNPFIADSDFVLNAMIIYASPTAMRMQ